MAKNRRRSRSGDTGTQPTGNEELPPTFLTHVDEWSSGYGEYEEIFSPEERKFITEHLQTTTNPLFRIRELNYHYEEGNQILDENPANWKKGDPIKFHGEMKSFSTSEDAVLDFGGQTVNPLVIFRTNGAVQNFPIYNYPHGYQWLKETLVPSEGWTVEKVTDVSSENKYKVQHNIGDTTFYEERPIFMVDIVHQDNS